MQKYSCQPRDIPEIFGIKLANAIIDMLGRTKHDVGDKLYDEVLHPTARRLLQHCDAVLRLAVDSKGANSDVRIARARGIPVYFSLDKIPAAS